MGLTEPQRAALRALVAACPGRPIALVGACALGCNLDLRWRYTEDLDLALGVELEELAALLEGRAEWRHDARLEHRWWFGELKLDLLPVPPSSPRATTLRWPGSETEMNLAGLDLALQHHSALDLGNGLSIGIPSIPLIVFLKIVSSLDRPAERERDLADIAFAFQDYLKDTDAWFEARLFDLPLQLEQIPAFLIGESLRPLIQEEHFSILEIFIQQLSQEDDFYHQRMRSLGPPALRSFPARLREQLEGLRLGVGLAHL